MAKIKGRKRNLKTVKELAAQKAQTRQRPTLVRRLLRLLFRPLVIAFKWLNQPAYIHGQVVGGAGAGSLLTKHRSMIPAYVRNSFMELRLTTWLRFPQALRLTVAVLLFAVFFALLVAGLDWLLTEVFREVILERGGNIKDLLNQ